MEDQALSGEEGDDDGWERVVGLTPEPYSGPGHRSVSTSFQGIIGLIRSSLQGFGVNQSND